ncbi:MAG: DMT family transporter [Psychromonas sp.]
MKNLFFSSLALISFAGNSVLCRYALTDEVIDAASFTVIRLFSGAIVLFLLVVFKKRMVFKLTEGNWLTSFYLFLYALTFSMAYTSLNTGVGALILFGAVQLTMVVGSILNGKMLSRFEWLGLVIAFSGLSYLLLPSENTVAPSLTGFILMLISGSAWGLYTLAGKSTLDPLLQTANNFIRTLPFVAILLLFTLKKANISTDGVLLAVASGAITSGLGYALWYVALKHLAVIQAAILQLTVPIIATFGGVFFLSEAISVQLIIATLLVLGGILIALWAKKTHK